MRTRIVWISLLAGALFLAGCNQNGLDSERASVVAFSRSYGAAPAAKPTPVASPTYRGMIDRLGGPLAPFDREASETLRMPLGSLAAVLYLRDTGLFATSSAIGQDGHFPPEIQAFQQVLQDSRAGAAFDYLIREGNPAGRLYGLCGLYFTNPRGFAVQVRELREKSKAVFTMEGNCARYLDVEEVLASRSPNVIQIPSPGLPPEEWSVLTGMPASGAMGDAEAIHLANVTMDISGGGFPCFLRWAKPIANAEPAAAAMDTSNASGDVNEPLVIASRDRL